MSLAPNSPLILPDRVVAAKTGTTQAWKDGWTMGYTPSLVAGVWTGNTNGSQMRAGADGVVTAGPIWHQFMLNALKDTPAETFPEPPGIQHIQVDAVSGKLPTNTPRPPKKKSLQVLPSPRILTMSMWQNKSISSTANLPLPDSSGFGGE
jgi:membrane carboxypeptidase/penicillin-binding protein